MLGLDNQYIYPPRVWAKSRESSVPKKKVEKRVILQERGQQMLKVLSMLYKRAGTIIYILMVLCFILVFLIILSAHNSSNFSFVVIFNVTMIRFTVYCLSMFLVVFF